MKAKPTDFPADYGGTRKRFRVEWTDPGTQEEHSEDRDFEGYGPITPELAAEDWAYAMADKGPHKVTEIK